MPNGNPKQNKGGEWYSRDLLIVINEKLRRGRCAYHHIYNNGAEHLVTLENYVEFAFDHVDRQSKQMTIAKLIGRYKSPNKLIVEMSKCILTCHNCHTRKGFDAGDFNIRQNIHQLGLFDAQQK
jgi:hypothetical protein